MDDAYLVYGGLSGRQSIDGTLQWIERYNVENVDVEGCHSDTRDYPLNAGNLPEIGKCYEGGWVCSGMSWQLDRELDTLAVVTAEYVRDPCSLPLEVSVYTSHKTMAAWRGAHSPGCGCDGPMPRERWPGARAHSPGKRASRGRPVVATANAQSRRQLNS